MTIPTITTGAIGAGYALDAASVTTATTSASISVPVGSMLLIAAGTQNANPGGASVGTPTFNGNAMTAQVSSPAGTITHGDWNGGGFWSWQNSGGSTVTGTITVPATGGTPQRLRMRAWIISGHSTSTPFQTVTAANLVNQSNGAADPALMPASGTLTAQVDGVLFLLALNFATAPAGSSFGPISDEYEMFQADSNYWISGYSAAASTGVSGTWTRGNTNGYKLFGLILNPAVSGTPPTPSTPTISGVSATSTTATATLTLATEGRSSVSVRYGTNGTTWTTITGTANQTSFSITGLTANTVYLLQARATNSAATVPDSAWSSSTTFGTENPVTGTGDLSGLPASAPTGMTSSNVSWTLATLGCSAFSGATSYDWQVRTVSGAYNTVISSATPSTQLSGLTASTDYRWQVRARNSFGYGPWSAEQSFTTSSTSSGGVILVSWTAASINISAA